MRSVTSVERLSREEGQPPAPFTHIFVATDFSAGASRAVARAGRLPLGAGGRVSVAHVLPDGLPQKTRVSAEQVVRRQLGQAVQELSERLGRNDVKVTSELCQGQTYVEIIRRARSAGAELVVIGRHGRRPVKDLFIGSTAERVIRAGDLPVLVVSRKASRPYREPVIAVDLKDTARAVVHTALRILGPEVTAARMVHAYHVPFEGFMTPAAAAEETTHLREEYRQAATADLTKLEASLDDLGVRWRRSIRRGDPRSVILAEVERRRADLVAVGTHGRSGLSHALVGSIAEWVIQAATCDVLVARPARVSFELP